MYIYYIQGNIADSSEYPNIKQTCHVTVTSQSCDKEQVSQFKVMYITNTYVVNSNNT